MIKINSNLFKFLGIFSILFGVVAMLSFKLFPIFSHNTIYYCRSFLSGSLINVPPIFHAAVITTLFLLFAVILTKLVLTLIKGYKFKKHLANRRITSEKLRPVIEELHLLKKVSVVKDKSPFAFCLGLRNPHIYISTQTIEMMTGNELKAILLHEKYHLQKKDGLIMQIASLTKIIFPFFPLISDLIQGYKLNREINADKEVISKLGKEPLVSVLTKLLTFPTVPMLTAAAIADVDTVESRIRAISHSQHANIKYNKLNLLISLFSLIFFSLFLVIPVQASEIHLNDNNMMMLCLNDEQCAALCRENTSIINGRLNYSSYSQNASYPFTSSE